MNIWWKESRKRLSKSERISMKACVNTTNSCPKNLKNKKHGWRIWWKHSNVDNENGQGYIKAGWICKQKWLQCYDIWCKCRIKQKQIEWLLCVKCLMPKSSISSSSRDSFMLLYILLVTQSSHLYCSSFQVNPSLYIYLILITLIDTDGKWFLIPLQRSCARGKPALGTNNRAYSCTPKRH